MTEVINGQTVTLRATFRDISGDPVDPAPVALAIVAPDGSVTNVNQAGLSNPSVGVWEYELTTTQTGIYRFRYTGVTTQGTAVCQGSVCVTASILVSA